MFKTLPIIMLNCLTISVTTLETSDLYFVKTGYILSLHIY